MSFRADLERAKLSVLLDVRNPFSYLALAPAVDLANELAIEIDWLPLQVPPLRQPSTPAEDDDRGIRHRRNRAQMIAREIETYAAIQGLVIRDLYRAGDPAAANLAWIWVRHHAADRLPGFLRELFRRYWSVELAPGDIVACAALVDEVAADGDGFTAWATKEGPAVASALAQEVRDYGLFQVPAYVIEDEVFYGRQHLPMIRWIISGREGRAPI